MSFLQVREIAKANAAKIRQSVKAELEAQLQIVSRQVQVGCAVQQDILSQV